MDKKAIVANGSQVAKMAAEQAYENGQRSYRVGAEFWGSIRGAKPMVFEMLETDRLKGTLTARVKRGFGMEKAPAKVYIITTIETLDKKRVYVLAPYEPKSEKSKAKRSKKAPKQPKD